jgi:hypothetical protein
VAVDMPLVAEDGMVVALDAGATSYLAAFQSSKVRFVGANNLFVTLDRQNPLQREVEATIARHHGELWGLEVPVDWPGMADDTLSFYGLVRAGCVPVRSTLDRDIIRMCHLRKAQP